jgi:hypothetical protein
MFDNNSAKKKKRKKVDGCDYLAINSDNYASGVGQVDGRFGPLLSSTCDVVSGGCRGLK